MAMKESEIQAQIADALIQSGRLVWVMTVTTGTFKVKGGFMKCGLYMMQDLKRRTGMSDLIGMTFDGRMAAIETKRPKENAKEHQAEFLATVRKYGGIAGVARNVTEALALFNVT